MSNVTDAKTTMQNCVASEFKPDTVVYEANALGNEQMLSSRSTKYLDPLSHKFLLGNI